MVRASRLWLWVPVVVAAASAIAGCSSSGAGSTPTVSAVTAVSFTSESPEQVRRALLAHADSDYTYDSLRAAVEVSDAIALGPAERPLPRVRIATAIPRTRDLTRVSNKFVAMIVADSAYEPMGLAPGENFLWHDTVRTSFAPYGRTLIVPRNTAYRMSWLQADTARYMPMRAIVPRLVKNVHGYGECSECDNGPLRHCPATRKHRDFDPRDVPSIRIWRPTSGAR